MATVAAGPELETSSRSLFDYWHLLSLDAPTVAVLWSYAFCRTLHTRPGVPAALFLGLGTWLLYVADRILDGTKTSQPHRLRERHLFHARHRRLFLVAALMVGGFLVAVTLLYVPRPMVRGFSVVLLAALTYFAIVHCESTIVAQWFPVDWWFPKEAAVGVIFAAAVAVPAWSQLSSVQTLSGWQFTAGVALFGALCWLNCVAIESWEQEETTVAASYRSLARKGPSSSSGFTLWAGAHVRGIAIGLAGISSCLWAGVSGRQGLPVVAPLYISVLISTAILLFLEGAKNRVSPLRLRVAADVALLTPLLLLAGRGW